MLSTAGSVVEADECNQCQPVSAENIPGGACSSDAECKGPTSDCQHCTFCQDTCECVSDQDCVETFGAGSTCDKLVVRENQCVLPQPTPAPTMPTPSPTMVPTATPTPPPTLSGCSEATWSHSRTDLSGPDLGWMMMHHGQYLLASFFLESSIRNLILRRISLQEELNPELFPGLRISATWRRRRYDSSL